MPGKWNSWVKVRVRMPVLIVVGAGLKLVRTKIAGFILFVMTCRERFQTVPYGPISMVQG